MGGRFQAFGDIYFVANPDTGLFVVKHPDHIRDLLVTRAGDYTKEHTAIKRLHTLLGDGLLTTDGELWRRHRRMIQPAFTRTALRGYADTMVEETERAAAHIAGQREVSLEREMMALTLRIVCRTLFSHDVGPMVDAVAKSMNSVQEAMVRPEFLPRLFGGRTERAIDTLNGAIYGMIRERREATRRGDDLPADLLQSLIEATDQEAEGGGAQLTERELRDELVTLFLAGHETTALTLTYALHLLGRHPEWRDRLVAEARSVDPARAFDDDVMVDTDRVLAEAMRMYPPAYLVARRAIVDTRLGGFFVPRGSEVLAWIYMTHHDPRWYPDPGRFDPERFTPAAEAERPRLAYLPFGAGPRTCIGKHFALVEARLVLSGLLRKVVLEPLDPSPVGVRPRVTLRPDRELPARVLAV